MNKTNGIIASRIAIEEDEVGQQHDLSETSETG